MKKRYFFKGSNIESNFDSINELAELIIDEHADRNLGIDKRIYLILYIKLFVLLTNENIDRVIMNNIDGVETYEINYSDDELVIDLINKTGFGLILEII